MNTVRFAFGDRPEISDLDARDIISMLSQHRSFGPIEAHDAIKRELKKEPEDRTDIALGKKALAALIEVLSGEPWEGDPLDVEHLLQQAKEAYARGEWAQEHP